ncbi:MAG: exodeoxyribonuclease V subunit gamma [Xanthomonadales bacterium]|jgi:exonuclease V gamma subunit|nr:exodeoxyribonuclease V subunit gamma [Xanthomonadales bacterium]
MPGFTIHRLSDPFALPTQLAAALRGAEPGLDPLAVVQVVLPGPAWRSWLTRALAEVSGVWAGIEWIDLQGWRRQLPSVAPGSQAARVLALYRALPQAAAADADLADWLGRDPDGGWRMALAQQLAQILAEDQLQRPMLGVEDAAAPAWWRALQSRIVPSPAPQALDHGTPAAALHWVGTMPPLAHDWALCAGLARALPVTLWLLEPDVPAALWMQLGIEAPSWPALLTAALRPLPLPLVPADGARAPLRAALTRGAAVSALPEGAVNTGSAATLFEQLRLAEAWLQARFARDTSLSPADVLLLSPAWPEAIPLIDAVFGAASGPAWPYRVGSRRAPSLTLSLFELLLDSPARRWTAQELVGALRQPALRVGLGLDGGAANRLQTTLAELPGGWGLDGGTRAVWEAGSDAAQTWAVLIPLLAERLDAADPLRTALPRLRAALRNYRDASRGVLALAAQRDALAALLRALLPAPGVDAGADAAWRAWAALQADWAGIDATLCLPQAAFARLLRGLLPPCVSDDPGRRPDTAAAEAGLCFAPLQAGAIRPARLIVLWGLDALSFPRRAASGPLEDWRAALDALHPALAPPAAAAIDRQLLLESLWMAADATLWLYTNRDVRTGQALPAPTPVAAALALLPPTSTLPALPPRASGAGRARALPNRAPPQKVELGALCDCFREPSRFQLEQVRGIRLPPAPLPEDGALSLCPRLAVRLRTQLLRRLERQQPLAEPDDAQRAALPPGSIGLAAWEMLCGEALALWQYQQNLMLDGGVPEIVPIDLATEDPPLQLTGKLTLHAGQLFERVAGKPHARHLVHAWVRALAAAAMEADAQDLVLLGLGAEGPTHMVVRLPAPAEAQLRIAELLAAWHAAWQRPLAFTPALGLALLDGGERDAHWHWTGTERTPGESQEPLNRALWSGASPTAPERLAELRRYSECLLPLRLRRPWRKQWP